MPTPRETILQALLAALQTVPDPTVRRGAILRDGDPGTPEVTLSPPRYHSEHRAEVEMIIQGKTPSDRDAAFDTLLQSLSTAIATDRTLGGLCDWVAAEAPHAVDLPAERFEALKATIVPVILTYTTADPLA